MAEAMRLARLIAHRGVASRREAEAAIAAGDVKVNGETVQGVVLVDPDKDKVIFRGRPLPPEPPKVYLLYYKPRGILVGRDDPQGRRTVFDELPDLPARVEPVGRLDLDTEGALLLTNDGELAHQLTHPSRRVPKRYLVKVYRTPDEADLDRIRQGKVYLEDGPAAPALVRVLKATDKDNAWVEITVTEGRNRLIRRIFEQLRHPVAKLRRESFATLSLRDMVRGQLRPLTGVEVRRLQEVAAGRDPRKAGKVRGKGFALPKRKLPRGGRTSRPRA